MIAKLWRRLFPVRIVEISDKTIPVVEDEESVRSLKHHPGFIILNNRLRIQKALLETDLRRKKHSDIRAVDRLQDGIFWLEYLQGEVDRSVGRHRQVEEAIPSDSDMDLFKKVRSQISGV